MRGNLARAPGARNGPAAHPCDDPRGGLAGVLVRPPARAGDEPEVLKAEDSPSEGSAPGVRAPARALAAMEPPAPYSQVVDNASPRRFFSGRGWKKGPRRAKHYGGTTSTYGLQRARPPRGSR